MGSGYLTLDCMERHLVQDNMDYKLKNMNRLEIMTNKDYNFLV